VRCEVTNHEDYRMALLLLIVAQWVVLSACQGEGIVREKDRHIFY
jgi:hypothetical protein